MIITVLAKCLKINGMDERAGIPTIIFAHGRWIPQKQILTPVSTIFYDYFTRLDIKEHKFLIIL